MRPNPFLLLVFCLCFPTYLSGGIVTVTNVSNNTDWSDARIPGSGAQRYDEISLTFTDCGNEEVQSLSFQMLLPGTFDDTAALDLNADGVIDWAITQDDWYAISLTQTYNPWVDSSPFEMSVEVTTTGTTVRAFWGGVEGTTGVGTVPGWNDISSMTLADMGFLPGGFVPSDSFTTNGIRLGNLNMAGPAGHGSVTTIPTDSIFVVSTVPEPQTFATFSLFAIALCSTRRRR